MANDWNAKKAEAMKILGAKGKVPDPKWNLAKVSADYIKADKEYDAAVDVLQTKILALQNMASTGKNSLKQYSEQISKSNLGLDPKNDDDKEKIEQARKLLDDHIDGLIEVQDINIKNLDELDKHSMAISKYESKC